MMDPPPPTARQARSVIPFIAVTLIWSSTWLVIRDQLAVVPASWSVTYRFLIAAVAMFVYAAAKRERLVLQRPALAGALIVGLAQFSLNFNFVYRAEEHITSGLVALLFALLIVPNALLARIFLGQGVSARFLAGSAVAIAGVALLFAKELTANDAAAGTIMLGIGFSLCAVLSASIANVIQAAPLMRSASMTSMLAWGMTFGVLLDGAWAWITTGPPVIEWRTGYIVGLLYLGLIASALAFPLYFGVIRAIGPARAAYSSVLIPVIAMGLSTLFEGYSWTVQSAAGCALTLVGLVVALRARNPAR